MFAVEMLNITKRFGDNLIANNNISFRVKKGEIHALVGENGAGKTTLMKILYGMHQADTGKILIDGIETNIENPYQAIANGIGMVHQHFMLVHGLRALENIILGDEKCPAFGKIDLQKAKTIVEKLCNDFNFYIPLHLMAEELPVGLQQKIEIIKLLYRDADILILDEPTAVLTPQETKELFKSLLRLKTQGKTVILITHKLGEVMEISDSVSVLRNGKLIAELVAKDISYSIANPDYYTAEQLILAISQMGYLLCGLSIQDEKYIHLENHLYQHCYTPVAGCIPSGHLPASPAQICRLLFRRNSLQSNLQ